MGGLATMHWSLYVKTINQASKIWSYMAGGLKINVQLPYTVNDIFGQNHLLSIGMQS